MTGKINALNSVQKIPETGLIANVVVQPNIIYTCPAGKKAILNGKIWCVNVGAAAQVYLNAAGIRICIWQAVGGDLNENRPENLAVNVAFTIKDITLSATQTLDTSQDAGANAQIKHNIKVLELPV